MNPLFNTIDKVIPDLRELENQDARILFIRRQLETAQEDFIKRGNRLQISRPLQYECPTCHKIQPDSEVLYLHMRKNHNHSDDEANTYVAELEGNYHKEVNLLKQLLRKYTGSLLNERFTDEDRDT